MTFDPTNREIRVFISSTFKDMSAEREYLINKVFPSLQYEAQRHNVRIVPVDLRWGITEAEASTGRVAAICLDQIDQSRPFFIGLIGHRYGWCPATADVAEARRHCARIAEWVDHGMSMTEIEMQYGVLDGDQKADALFLLKSDTKGSKPEKGIAELRQKVLEKHPGATFWYSDLETIGEHVRQQLLQLMDKYFPITDATPAQQAVDLIWEETVASEEWYADTGLKLDSGDAPLTLITGDTGSGKTTAAAHRASQLLMGDDTTVIYLRCDDYTHRYDREMCLEILREQLFQLLPERARTVLKDADLYTVAGVASELLHDNEGKRLHVVIDGLQWVTDWSPRDIASELLFPFLYKNRGKIEIFLHPDNLEQPLGLMLQQPYTDVQARVVPLPEVDPGARWLFILRYLRHFAKRLPNELSGALAKRPISMWLLRQILQEIVAYGTFETLPEYINKLMQISEPQEFFEHVLQKARASLPQKELRQLLAVLEEISTGLPQDVLQRDVLQWTPLQWAEAEGMLRPLLRGTRHGIALWNDALKQHISVTLTATELQQAQQSIAAALHGTTTHRVELAMQLYCVGTPSQLHKLLVEEGAACDMIAEGYHRQAFVILRDMIQAIPGKLTLGPLVTYLENRLQGQTPDSPQWNETRNIARLLLLFSSEGGFNPLFASRLLHGPLHLADTFDSVTLSRMEFGPTPNNWIDAINRGRQSLPEAYVPLIEHYLRQGEMLDAASLMHKAMEALDDSYRTSHPVETIEIEMLEAYVAMREGNIGRARTILFNAEDTDRLDHHYPTMLRLQGAHAVIDFLWDLQYAQGNETTLQASLKKLHAVVKEAEQLLGSQWRVLKLELTRALVMLMLTQKEMVREAKDVWCHAVDDQDLDLDLQTPLTRGEIPYWLAAAMTPQQRQAWIANVVEFSAMGSNDRWLDEALFWQRQLGNGIEDPQLEARRARRVEEYEKGDVNFSYALLARIIWPWLVQRYDDNIYLQTIERLGGFQNCELATAFGDMMRLSQYQVRGEAFDCDMEGLLVNLGGDGMLRQMCLMLLEIFGCDKGRYPELMAGCHILDPDSLERTAADPGWCSQDRKLLLVEARLLRQLPIFAAELAHTACR